MLTENLSYSVPAWVFEAAQKYSEKTAFIQYVKINAQESESYSKIEISYGEFLTKILNISQFLSKTLGVKSGDRVAICSESMPKWFAAYLAASALGAICVPIDSELGESEIKNLTEASGAEVIFTGITVKEKVKSALNGLNKTIIPFDSPDFINSWESKAAPEFDYKKHLPSNSIRERAAFLT
ncbi:MAG: AMP-binding protein [Nitrospirae bacterium]|nr:AMP-binding protein [Nitrospirota bacterium]